MKWCWWCSFYWRVISLKAKFVKYFSIHCTPTSVNLCRHNKETCDISGFKQLKLGLKRWISLFSFDKLQIFLRFVPLNKQQVADVYSYEGLACFDQTAFGLVTQVNEGSKIKIECARSFDCDVILCLSRSLEHSQNTNSLFTTTSIYPHL